MEWVKWDACCSCPMSCMIPCSIVQGLGGVDAALAVNEFLNHNTQTAQCNGQENFFHPAKLP